MKIIHHNLLIAMLIAILLFPALALTSPKDDLAKTQAEIHASESERIRLTKEQQKLEEELGEIQKKLVRAAAKLQHSEQKLNEAENKLQSAQNELSDKQTNFASQRQKLDLLLRTAFRLSKTPPQAMMLMPESGVRHVQSANAMKIILADVKRESNLLQSKMLPLQEIMQRWKTQKAEATRLQAEYRDIQSAFEVAIKQRTELRDRLIVSKEKEEDKYAALVKKARTLESLLSSLQKAEKEAEAIVIERKKGKKRDFSSAKGKLRAPLSGKITKHFGQKDSSGGEHKGITISTRGKTTVVAVYDAEVVYTGEFLNYGNMVILKHSGDYHTLLSGLAYISVKKGEFLLEGEPIGVMEDSLRADLYVELRDNNQPINPEKWFRGL